ncbi:MAG: IS200/IS605 family transposase [Rudanella sp.]|nr:IS200/IS605 family transposase [Rudanella sp.]
MPNTYTQLYAQIVFAVKGRQNLIPKARKEELHRYITGIVKERGQKLMAVHCMPDHTHLFVGFSPTIALSDLIHDIKRATSLWIKEQRIVQRKFYWQDGYGAFTYSQSQIHDVVQYILNQEEHHRTRTFGQEYRAYLTRFEIPFDPQYLFEFYEPETTE